MTPGDSPIQTPNLLPLPEAAQRLRREIKARFGLTRQQVRILSRSDTRGEVLFVDVRVPGVSLRRLDRVVEPFRRAGWRRVEVLLETAVLIPHDPEILRRLLALPLLGPQTFHPLRFGRYVFQVSAEAGPYDTHFPASRSQHAALLLERVALRPQARPHPRSVPPVAPPARPHNFEGAPVMSDEISPFFLIGLEYRLQLLAVAEAEITRAVELFPARRPLLVRAGRSITQPDGLLAQAPPWLFRAHCRELLERLADGDDTSGATVAELAAALGCVNRHAPPSAAARALEASLFLQALELGEADIHESERRSLETDRAAADPFQAEDLLKTLARRLADPSRRPRRVRQGASRFVQLELLPAAA